MFASVGCSPDFSNYNWISCMWLKNGRSNLWRGQDRSSPYFCFPFLHGCISSQGKHGFFVVKIWDYTSKTLPAEVLSSCPKADWNCSRWMVSSWCFPIARSGGFELDGPRLGFPDFWVPTAVLKQSRLKCQLQIWRNYLLLWQRSASIWQITKQPET